MSAASLLPSALALLAVCITAETAMQLSFKLGAERAEGSGAAVGVVLRQPLIWLGVLLWVVQSIAWVQVLQTSPLSRAYPVMTLTYATVPLAGLLVLREPMGRRQMFGAALIFAGVLLIGVSGA